MERTTTAIALGLVLGALAACGILTPDATPPPGGYWGESCGDHFCRKDEMCTPKGCEWVGPTIPDSNGAFAEAKRPADAGDDADGAP